MADVAQLVRALVCGTRCRQFESDHPPHLIEGVCNMAPFLGSSSKLGARVKNYKS